MKSILSIILCLAFVGATAQCTTSGPLSGTNFTDVNTGSFAFSNPSYLAMSDNNRASASAVLTVLTGTTDQLQAKGFNFNVPSYASICGIQVAVEKSASNISLLATISDHEVRLLKGGITIGNNKTDPSNWSTTESYTVYGGSNDLWGTTWSPAQVNNSNFGVSFSAEINGIVGLFPSARVNHIQVTVYYSSVVLPISQTGLSAENTEEGYIKISWPNTVETKVTLQRSIDSRQWSVIYTGVDNHFTDQEINSNMKYYYRLVADNKQFSKIIEVTASHSSRLSIYPNPSADFIIITELPKVSSIIPVIDTYGHIFRLPVQPMAEGKYKVDVTILPKGIYCLAGLRKLSFVKQ